MRLALLTGVAAAALSFIGTAGAQTIYTTDSDFVADPNVVVSQPNVIATRPGYVYAVPAPPFGPFTPQYVVTQPTVVVAPPAVVPQERVIIAPSDPVVAAPRESGIITTGYSSSGCLIDRNGFERCY